MEITKDLYDRQSHGTKEESDIPLLPIKDIETRSYDKRGPWQVKDPDSIIHTSMQDGELVIDYEHQSSYTTQNGRPAPAAGWIVDMFVDSNRQYIMGRVHWTKKALLMIQNKEYRYISPTFLMNNERQITQIIGAGLVNQPAITELPAITAKTTGNGFVGNIGRMLALGKTHTLYTYTSALPPTENIDAMAHERLQTASSNGWITPAQQKIAYRCFLKAGEDFYQFLESTISYPQVTHAKSPAPVAIEPTSSEKEVIACLGIEPQLFSQLKSQRNTNNDPLL